MFQFVHWHMHFYTPPALDISLEPVDFAAEWLDLSQHDGWKWHPLIAVLLQPLTYTATSPPLPRSQWPVVPTLASHECPPKDLCRENCRRVHHARISAAGTPGSTADGPGTCRVYTKSDTKVQMNEKSRLQSDETQQLLLFAQGL